MILNLNQVNFRGFGTILPERSPASRQAGKDIWQETLHLASDSNPLYQARSETWLCCVSGMTVLSVSENGQEFFHYYLDKPVYVKKGVYFSLSAFLGESAATASAGTAPETAGTYSQAEGFQVRHKLQVESLYTFFYQEKEQGFFFPGEVHAMLELTYVDQGSLHSVADGQDLLLEQGDMVLYMPNQWHMQYADIGVAPRFVTVSFDVTGDSLDSLFNRRLRCPQKALPVLQRMLQEMDRMDAYSSDMIIHMLSIILLMLQRELGAPSEKLKTAHSIHNENEIISRAQQYISGHIRQKLSVPLVARNVDVSPSYLTALFHKHLQISPGEYIRRIKLQESKQMIRENTMNFTEIAAALQYSTVHHFSRQFKEKFGITPSEYAKSVR